MKLAALRSHCPTNHTVIKRIHRACATKAPSCSVPFVKSAVSRLGTTHSSTADWQLAAGIGGYGVSNRDQTLSTKLKIAGKIHEIAPLPWFSEIFAGFAVMAYAAATRFLRPEGCRPMMPTGARPEYPCVKYIEIAVLVLDMDNRFRM
jgi:hypothetical protein